MTRFLRSAARASRRLRFLLPSLLLAWATTHPPAFAQELGAVSGTVKDAAGTSIVGAAVTAWGPVKRTATTGLEGGYRLGGLPLGTYRLVATFPGFVAAEKTVEVTGKDAVEAALTLSVALGEQVVVTASRTESSLADAPATMSVIDAKTIALTPAANIPDLLRSVPGLNVVQSSARDVNLSSRQASAFLTPSQLTLVDGRPLYFDFFNVVFWDLISVGIPDIDQIEVVRGPAATMWGANAVTGVVNILTKPPSQSPGLQMTLTGGGFGRGSDDNGGIFGLSARYAEVLSDRLSYRVSAGFTHSDAFERPHGTVPISTSPLDPSVRVGGGSFDAAGYTNRGTAQPHADVRADQLVGETGRIVYSAGLAATSGIIQTPIGPFDIEKSSKLGYGRVAYTDGGFRLSAFANILAGKAPSLVTRDARGQPILIDFDNGAYDIDAGYTRLVGARHLLSAGASFRYDTFGLSIAPDAKNRSQVGVYVHDEIDLGRFHAALGARVDKFQNLASASFSPRVVLSYTPWDRHMFRASYNRAFRAPSAIENSLDISVVGGAFPLGLVDPRFGNQQFPIVTRTVGNPDLKAESVDAFEIGYTANLGAMRFEINLYRNETDHLISTTPGPRALLSQGIQPFYTSQNPPPGWPLPPLVLDYLAAQGIAFPSYVKTLNLGRVRNEGLEVSIQRSLGRGTSAYISYSYQAVPSLPDDASDPLRPPADTISVPPRQRFGFGILFSGERWLGSFAVHHAERAFWTQVLSPQYYGYSKDYVLVNATLGRRWAGGRFVTSIKGTNLLGDRIRQHVFGDYLNRSIVAEIQAGF